MEKRSKIWYTILIGILFLTNIILVIVKINTNDKKYIIFDIAGFLLEGMYLYFLWKKTPTIKNKGGKPDDKRY